MKKLRVYHMPQVGVNCPTLYIPVENEIEAVKTMYLLSCYDLFQLNHNIKPDFSNSCGVQMWDEESLEWEDWVLEAPDEYYDDIEIYLEEIGEPTHAEYAKKLFSQV